MSFGERNDVTITVCNLGKAYHLRRPPSESLFGRKKSSQEDFWALRNVDFELRRGETLGVLGVNGAGKSTLLQLICGVVKPTTGNVATSGRVASLLGLGAGFHPQFTGRENVRLKAAALGLNRQQINERMDSIVGFAGIGEFVDLPVRVYSSGMYARLAFAVCAHVDADILIVDEILAVGDAAFRQKCSRFINRFRERGTVLLVSHNSATVAELCQRALWLEHGRVREIGLAAEVSAHYLASISEENGDRPQFVTTGPTGRWWAPPPPPLLSDWRDRNAAKMSISAFDRTAPWHGVGGLVIEDLGFYTPAGIRLAFVSSEDEVELQIRARAERRIVQPILGFIVRDRFGQNVFGDNTYVSYLQSPPAVEAGARIEGAFRFQMPCLADGNYTITVAFVDGTQDEHTHIQWIEDALSVRVFESPVTRGIVGLPSKNIKLESIAGENL